MGKQKTYFILAISLLLCCGVYSFVATKSSIWYDEAVEFFYSRSIFGNVPWNHSSSNMYERIVETFQPPLYNILMFFWLRISESTFWFRMAGVFTSLIGAVGIYKIINETVCHKVLANIGSIVYLLIPVISHYTLECAEYNLMLCFVAWSLLYFIRFGQNKDGRSLICYIVFSILAVYSQYGAAFIVFSTFIIISAEVFSSHNVKIMKLYACLLCVALTFAAALYVFFLDKQLTNQGTMSISHLPVLYHGFIRDYFLAIESNIIFWLNDESPRYIVSKLVLLVVPFVGVKAILSRNRMFFQLLACSFIAWNCYFVAVVCSFYAHVNFKDTLGSANFGNRYSLFLVPLLFVTFFISAIICIRGKKSGFGDKWLYRLFLVGMFVFIAVRIYGVCYTDEKFYKSNVSENIVAEWYSNEAFGSITILTSQQSRSFFYYLHKRDPEMHFAENIRIIPNRNKDFDPLTLVLETDLVEKIADLNVFYTVQYAKNFDETIFEADGYHVTVICEERNNRLLRLERIGIE